jgi:hypothetical protein
VRVVIDFFTRHGRTAAAAAAAAQA